MVKNLPEQSDISVIEAVKSRHKKFWKKGIIFGSVLILLVGGVLWKSSGKSTSVQFITEDVKEGDLIVVVTATGTLQPTNQVDVGSELSGIIKSVEVNYNDRIKVGQILARLDTSKLEAQIAQAKAALDSARAKVLQTEATVRETKTKLEQLREVWKISNKKVPSKTELDAAEATFDRAKADAAAAKAALAQAQATLRTYETDLSKSSIRSPVNGVVLARKVEPGQTVAASLQAPVLFTLAEDLTKMELHVNVDEADIGRVKEGQEASFTVAAYPHQSFNAIITQVRLGSSNTSGVVTYETVLSVDNSNLLLRPGMTATADIVVNKIKNGVLIPNSALRFTPPVTMQKNHTGGSLLSRLIPRTPPSHTSGGREKEQNNKESRVFTLQQSKPVPLYIVTGDTDGTMTEVLKGNIKPGMPVIVDYNDNSKK